MSLLLICFLEICTPFSHRSFVIVLERDCAESFAHLEKLDFLKFFAICDWTVPIGLWWIRYPIFEEPNHVPRA